ncbi:MAG UNVERIFIED_CONTAM: hypothetical protein LVT10_12015 [Anaerolineae bacterium]
MVMLTVYDARVRQRDFLLEITRALTATRFGRGAQDGASCFGGDVGRKSG